MAYITIVSDKETDEITITVVGDDRLPPEEFKKARAEPFRVIDLSDDWAGVLVGFTPAHFAGWSHNDLNGAVYQLLELANHRALELDLWQLWIVGSEPPSPERLATLLGYDDPLGRDCKRVHELALTWMTSRVPA